MKWEYRVELFFVIGLASNVDRLNKLGEEGWELVAFTTKMEGERDHEAIFKRPKSN